MGCTSSSDKKSKTIEKHLKAFKQNVNREVTMLLLGAGESGKSTIAKQMRLIHLEGFNDQDRLFYKQVIYSNILECFQELIKYAIKSEFITTHNDLEKILALKSNSDNFTANLIQLRDFLIDTWKEDGIQKAYNFRNKFQLIDSCNFFMENLNNILQDNYLPDNMEILFCRHKTTGVNETLFSIREYNFKMIDVGGQRSERRKWINIFDRVKSVIFCTSLSEYDQILYEDETVNRMRESLKLFDEVSNSVYFENRPIILFFNKYDLFKQKIDTVSLHDYFDDYEGGTDAQQAMEYIIKKFLSQVNSDKKIFTHTTTAVDTDNVKFTFDAVNSVLFNNIMDENGLDLVV